MSKCGDKLHNSDNNSLIYIDVHCNTTTFNKEVKMIKWCLNEAYVEYFKMPHNYLVDSFSGEFRQHLIKISQLGMLK